MDTRKILYSHFCRYAIKQLSSSTLLTLNVVLMLRALSKVLVNYCSVGVDEFTISYSMVGGEIFD